MNKNLYYFIFSTLDKTYNDIEFNNHQLITIKDFITYEIYNNNININMSYLECYNYINIIIVKLKVKISPKYIMNILQGIEHTSSKNIFNLSRHIYIFLLKTEKVDFTTMKSIENYIENYCYLNINLSFLEIFSYLKQSEIIEINDINERINIICNNIEKINLNNKLYQNNKKRLKII